MGRPPARGRDPRFELGAGVTMRPLALRDIEPLQAVVQANREHLRRWLPWIDRSPQGTAAYVERAVRDAAAGEGLSMAIFRDGAPVGVVAFVHPSRERPVTSIGYWLAHGAQGQGIMTRAVAALLGEAFGSWGLERVEIRVAAENARSRAIPERLGFREGRPIRVHRVDGSVHQEVVYGLTAREWGRWGPDREPPHSPSRGRGRRAR